MPCHTLIKGVIEEELKCVYVCGTRKYIDTNHAWQAKLCAKKVLAI